MVLLNNNDSTFNAMYSMNRKILWCTEICEQTDYLEQSGKDSGDERYTDAQGRKSMVRSRQTIGSS